MADHIYTKIVNSSFEIFIPNLCALDVFCFVEKYWEGTFYPKMKLRNSINFGDHLKFYSNLYFSASCFEIKTAFNQESIQLKSSSSKILKCSFAQR